MRYQKDISSGFFGKIANKSMKITAEKNKIGTKKIF